MKAIEGWTNSAVKCVDLRIANAHQAEGGRRPHLVEDEGLVITWIRDPASLVCELS